RYLDRDRDLVPERPIDRVAHRPVGADAQLGWHGSASADIGAPLFVNTAAGRAYQAEHERKLRAMEAEMQSIERALAATAESLELSNSTIISLRRQLHRDLREELPRIDLGSPRQDERQRGDRHDGEPTDDEHGWTPVNGVGPSPNGQYAR
ncbi:MAG: hypothetical protein HZB15_08180, partial [Actinobacteria bacterium]|nr:hypothetical protein [Actinomycetota bacterium]